MKHFKSKLMFAIFMIAAFTSKSQTWNDFGLPPGLQTGPTNRSGPTAIGQPATPPNVLLIVGYASGSNSNIGQWHKGSYGNHNAGNPDQWIEIGNTPTLAGAYGIELAYGASYAMFHLIDDGAGLRNAEISFGACNNTAPRLLISGDAACAGALVPVASFYLNGSMTLGPTFAAQSAWSNGGLSVEESVSIGTLSAGSRLLVYDGGATIGTVDAAFIASDGDLLVADKIGINLSTAVPQNNLTIDGNASIGHNIAFTNAPTNGLLVEGVTGIGIGTTAPNYAATLDVGGDIVIGDVNPGSLNPGLGSRFIIHTRPGFSYAGDFLVFSCDEGTSRGGNGVFFNTTKNDLVYGRSADGWSIAYPPSGTYPLAVGGNGITASAFVTISDERLKQDVATLGNPIENLKKLNPVTYTFKQDIMFDYMGKPRKFDLPIEKQYGFIAQDVKKIFPELVKKTIGDYYGINYTEFIPMLVAGMQKQQNAIEQLQVKVQEDQIKLACLPICDGTKQDNNQNDGSLGKLEQNVPNPFGTETTIKFTLPPNTKTGMILISNLEGKQLQKINIGSDATQIKIAASSLAAATYYYTLITDGKVIDTKKMIIIGD